MNPIEVKAALQISKPAEEIYEAIVNPEIMCNYFISKGSARLQPMTTVYWQFPEFPFDSPVRVHEMEPNHLIRFAWDSESGRELTVEMLLEPQHNGSTVVRVSEKGMELNEEGLAWLVSNTEGWANFLTCLKAWLEYGVNLRKGAYDFMVTNENA